MRVIEKKMLAAIKARKNWKCRNMEVEWLERQDVCVPGIQNEYKVKLHGHTIFHYYRGQARWTLAGWNTVTTRSRLQALGISVVQRAYAPALHMNWLKKEVNGTGTIRYREVKKDIDSTAWYDVEGNEVKV